MPQPYDWPLEKLRAYQPALTREADFEIFWARAEQELSKTWLVYELMPYDYPVRNARFTI